MAKVTLRASGGLNKDVDPNNLQDGDYVDALNMVFDTGIAGGASAMRMYESFAETGVTVPGTVKATFQNSDGVIYILSRINSTTSGIYKVPTSLSTFTKVLDYPHTGVSDSFVPDLKVIGNSLVWNYAEEGTLLSFFLDRTQNASYTLADLKLQKNPPVNQFTIAKSFTGSPVSYLESNDFQFASRYQYDSKEYSVLSNFSQMYKGEKGVTKYTFQYTFSGVPSFATYIELYARVGNNGVWRRIDTKPTSTNASFEFIGDSYEALDSVSSIKQFDAIPQNAKHIEIAKNRVFLANIQDDYSMSAANTDIAITSANETALSSGTYNSYLGAVTATSSETSTDGSGYSKPFANNSTYAVGLAFYDSALKTRGVEPNTVHKFSTGKFAYPLTKKFTVTPGGTFVRPSWAKYVQLCFTKNVSKSYVYEGYASNIFFELNTIETNPTTLEVKQKITIIQSITDTQVKDVKSFVVDLMGMFAAGYVYTFQVGDRITIKTPLVANSGILDLKIVAQNGNLIYCEYSGGAMTNPAVPVPGNNYFEIYSPSTQQEDESLLFYEDGNLIPIDDSWTGGLFEPTGTLNSSKVIGDMVFTKFEMPVYSNAPFLYNVEKPVPSTDYIVEDRVTEALCSMVTSGEAISATLDSTYNPFLNTAANKRFTQKINPLWTSLGTNQDTASIVESGAGFKVSGFYETKEQDATVNKITLDYKFKITNTLTYQTVDDPTTLSGGLDFSVSAQLFRVPYDNIKNVYGKVEAVSGALFLGGNATDSTFNVTGSQTLVMPTDIQKDINANDKFYVQLEFDATLSGDVEQAVITFGKPDSGVPIKLTLNGDRTTPKVLSSYNPNAILSATNTKYLIRSISNATSNQQWNTSAGKPLLASTNLSYPRRTNSIRYSGNYIPGTSVNNINSFFGLDVNDVPIENGEIMSLQRASRLQGNGSMLLALCQREASYIFLGEQELSQGNNTSIRALTTNMIGTIRNLGNNYGLKDKGSVMNYKGNIWWWDDFNKKVIKYTDQGVMVPSDTYMRSYFLNQGGDGNIAKFAYDPYYDMCFIGFISGGISLGYSDKLGRWISTYSFRTGFAESYGDRMVLIRDSVMYKSGQGGYNAFFAGTVYETTVSFIVNTKTPVMPQYLSIWHDMNVVNYSNTNGVKSTLLKIDITNENNQVSEITEGNFLVEDNKLYAHILRDMNTTGSIVRSNLIEGNYIVGYLNKFVVTLRDRSQNMRVNSIEIEVQPVIGHS